MKILMLKGLPGSGKSTYAKGIVERDGNWVRVNKDTIRDMMGGYTNKKEGLVIRFRNALIRTALDEGKNVIVDDTNFHPKHEAAISQIARDFESEFEIYYVNIPLEACIKNDLNRPVSVGEKVIRRMYEDYVRPAFHKVERNEKLPKAVICDLDGTLALHNGRDPYDASTCDQDLVNQPVAEAIWKYGRDDYEILFTSGREEQFRPQTMKFLARAGMPRYQLFMRKTGDHRKDHVVKNELYWEFIDKNYNVEAVFDDRQRVVDMWRDMGFTVFQVADGNF